MHTALRHAAGGAARRAKKIFYAVLGQLTVLWLKAVCHTNPERLVDFAGRFMRRIGPWLPEHRIGRANLTAAFPQWPPAEIERVLGGVWENLGQLGAEFLHLDHL